jgi:hypothetical protein
MTVAQTFDHYVESKVFAPKTTLIFARTTAKTVGQGIGAVKLAALKPSQIEAFAPRAPR